MITNTPEPPYYAVIFSSIRNDIDHEEYHKTNQELEELARQIPGFIGQESARNSNDNFGIAVSYWKDLESIDQWRQNIKHQAAKKKGINKWYKIFKLRIAKVEK